MDNKPFLTVVMPIYNVEKYLKGALDSVLKQSFCDYEIILVDDCSPDESYKICNEYCEKYDFIHYVKHSENMGLSAARNTGIKNATGKYIWFMDPDDVLDGELFKTAYEKTVNKDFDVLIFGFREKYYSKSGKLTKTVEIPLQDRELNGKAQIGEQILNLEKITAYGYAWNKFYLLENIQKNEHLYENIPLTEDIKFNIKYFDIATSVAMLGICPYCYAKRQSAGSITSKFVPRYFEVHRERVEMLYSQCEHFGVCDDTAKNILGNIFVRYIFSALSRNCDKRSKMTHKARKEWLCKLFEDKLFCELIPFCAADSVLLKVMIRLLKSKRTFLCLMLARVIYFTQNNAKGMFTLLKQIRK